MLFWFSTWPLLTPSPLPKLSVLAKIIYLIVNFSFSLWCENYVCPGLWHYSFVLHNSSSPHISSFANRIDTCTWFRTIIFRVVEKSCEHRIWQIPLVLCSAASSSAFRVLGSTDNQLNLYIRDTDTDNRYRYRLTWNHIGICLIYILKFV